MLYPLVSHYLLFIIYIYPKIPITYFRPGLVVDYDYYRGYIESFEIQGYTNQYSIYIYYICISQRIYVGCILW